MIRTHREKDKDRRCARDNEPCFVCGVLAHYWTQDEYPDGQAQGPVVFHCQRHRKEARQKAAIAKPPAGSWECWGCGLTVIGPECPECGAEQYPD